MRLFTVSLQTFAAIGFLIFYLLERITLIHVGHEAAMSVARHEHVGTIGAGGMSVHRLLHGLAVGAAFHEASSLGSSSQWWSSSMTSPMAPAR